MKKPYLLLIVSLGMMIASCGPSDGHSSISRLSFEPSGSSSKGFSSVKSYEEPSDVKDDSIGLNTVVENGFSSARVGDLLQSFDKVDYGYYGGTFEKKLKEPSSTVASHEDLVKLFDYCAFYRIKEKNITININGLSKIEECNLAVWDSTLIPGTVGTVFTANSDGTIKVEFKYNDNANSYVPKQELGENVLYSYFPYVYDYANEGKTLINSIPYVGETELDVHNSDQLIYALLNGYKPVMQDGSPAKRIYDFACQSLKSFIYSDMKDNEKLMAIDFFIANSTNYDYLSDDTAAYVSKNHANNVEELACMFRGFYAEGVFFNSGAVCYGYAKAQALLASLLGFQVRLTHGKIDALSKDSNDPILLNNESGNIYSSHGISLVRKDSNSKWGICDPTYRSAGSLTLGNDDVQFKRSPAVMISYETWSQIYTNADEVGLKYIPENEKVEESYSLRDDYRLVGGSTLTPSDMTESIKAMNDAFATVKRVKEELHKGNGYYVITFYPYCNSDEEALNYYYLYYEAKNSSELASTTTYFAAWQRADLCNFYGLSVYIYL